MTKEPVAAVHKVERREVLDVDFAEKTEWETPEDR